MAQLLFHLGFAVSRLVSLAVLVVCVGYWALLLVFFVECLGQLVIRMSIKNWRYYRAGADSANQAVAFHVCEYLCFQVAPLQALRMPFLWTPRVYVGMLLYTLLVSNPMLAGIAFVVGGPQLPSGFMMILIFQLLGVSTIVCILAAVAFFATIPTHLRRTYIGHLIWSMHIATFWWNEKTQDEHGGITYHNQEAVRARLIMWVSPHYLRIVMPQLKEFFKAHWSKWEMERPNFFTDDFKTVAVSLGLRPAPREAPNASAAEEAL